MKVWMFCILMFMCLVCIFVGYIIGRKNGIILGMQQFLSVLKVYDNGIVDEINELLHKVDNMSHEEKISKFTSYLENISDLDD